MSTSTYYNFIDSANVEHNNRPLRSNQDMNQIDQHRQTAISPAASFATSSSESSSSLNSQFNSLTPNSAASSSTTYSSSSSTASSSSSSNASSSNLVNSVATNKLIPPAGHVSAGPHSLATTTTTSATTFNRDLIRQSSVTPTRNHLQNDRHHSPSQLTHSYTLHSLEPKPLKPFKSRSAYIDAMKEDLAEWLNSIYSDLELTPEKFFAQLETGAIICRHANNVTQMGRNMMVEQTASAVANSDAASSSDNENNGSINDSSINSHQNSLSSPSPDHDDNQHRQLTSLNFIANSHQFHSRHRHSTANSSISSISTTTSSSTGRHRLSLTSSTAYTGSRFSDRTIDWFRVKVIPYKSDAGPGTFFARDNICQFIMWCRSLNILDCLLFETDDLVARKNEKSFILCLLEVARIGFKVGMPTPLIIQLEQEIDREIENDAKLQKQLEEAARKQAERPDDNLSFGCVTGARSANEVSNDNDKNNNNNENEDGLACAVERQLDLKSENDDRCISRANGSAVTEVELDKNRANGHDAPKQSETSRENYDEKDKEEDFGPKPQVITNDLLSLHERVVQLLCQCTCPTQFPMVRIGDGKYKVGDKLIIFVRILRRHIMVRVGGGWQELSEFLRQKDPCRTKLSHSGYLTQPQHFTGGGSRLTLNALSSSPAPSSLAAAPTPTPSSPITSTNSTTSTGTTNFRSIPVWRSRLVGSSQQLNHSKGHKTHEASNGSNGQRMISGSASMSWLSHN